MRFSAKIKGTAIAALLFPLAATAISHYAAASPAPRQMEETALAPAEAVEPGERRVRTSEQGLSREQKDFLRQILQSRYKRGYRSKVNAVRANRAAVREGLMGMSEAAVRGGLSVEGQGAAPVLMTMFSDTASAPYPVSDLQTQLFNGPWPTGTMTEYYEEVSHGKFSVTGTVFEWQRLPEDDNFYEGGCNGLCRQAKMGDFLKHTFDAHDAAVDFSQYDNDGPDGVPNSGDDDGFVDFVAIVHPESGGECGGRGNIWSHRWTYSSWAPNEVYTTNDDSAVGGKIKIDDYVIMPALACDNTTMIPIGVFAHEYGHAFGLPDLYDTDNSSAGIGTWGLMAAGSWGGDDKSPELPSHMSAWSKAFLGWVEPVEVETEEAVRRIKAATDSPEMLRVRIDDDRYYLIENRQKKKFDGKLFTSGLAIWRVNENVVETGLQNNTVNADETDMGVALIQADGRKHLENKVNRGDEDDLFPGNPARRRFDSTTSPAAESAAAICAISDPGDVMGVTIRQAAACPEGSPVEETARVTALASSGFPQHVRFRIDKDFGECAADAQLSYAPKGATAERIEDAEAVFELLRSALVDQAELSIAGANPQADEESCRIRRVERP